MRIKDMMIIALGLPTLYFVDQLRSNERANKIRRIKISSKYKSYRYGHVGGVTKWIRGQL